MNRRGKGLDTDGWDGGPGVDRGSSGARIEFFAATDGGDHGGSCDHCNESDSENQVMHAQTSSEKRAIRLGTHSISPEAMVHL